ncbi:MAG TPA: tetratricopeptide repeat protein, partial [Terriglobia bacterium]|nr:tetratricopeptide repeat protein [Terriglobia bacterium]
EGRFRDAVATLEKALERNPRLLPSNLILGLDLVRLGEPGQALKPIEAVLAQEPSNHDALFGLAGAYFALNRMDDAAHAYLRDVAVRPKDTAAWYGMGVCFERLAENSARQMSQEDAQSPYYQRLVGEFLLRQGAELDAEQAFRQALAGAHKSGALELHAALGFVQLRLGRFSQAQNEFNVELREHPGSLEAQLGLAALELNQGQAAKASKQLCAVRHADPGFWMTHLGFLADSLDSKVAADLTRAEPSDASSCGGVLKSLQSELASPGAQTGDEQAFETSPSSSKSTSAAVSASVARDRAAAASGHYTKCATALAAASLTSAPDRLLFARCACRAGRFLAAREAAREALRQGPHNAEALYWSSEASKKLAQAAFLRAMRLDPNSWQGRVLAGDIYRQRKQWDLARSNYLAAARLKPSSPAPYLGIATVDWQNGEFEKAQSALQETLARDPQNLQASFESGDILVRQRHFREAIPYLEKTVAGEPELLAAHADLGKCYAALGGANRAIEELNRALPMDRAGDLHYLLYVEYKRQGHMKLARTALTESQKLRAVNLEMQQHRLNEALESAQSKR